MWHSAETVVFAILPAISGAITGVLFPYLMLDAIRGLLIEALSRGADVMVNLPVMVAALAVAVLTSVVGAIFPSLRL